MSAWPTRLLLDGAVGTELIARGLAAGSECPEAWNLERPDDVQALHAAYFEAGAQAVQTNTFGGNRLRLSLFGRQTEVRSLNVAAALLAREVRPTGAFVIGSLGPTGALPPPEGNADLIELEDTYAEQAMALSEGGVDALHIETQYHPKEARAAIRGAREGAPGLRLIASMTCRRHGSSYTTRLGFAPEVLLQVFLEEGVHAVGLNCTLAPADMLDLVRLIKGRTELPILAKPALAPNGTTRLPPEEMATGALALFAAGAWAVGGCCGAGPDHIRAAKAALDRAPSSLEELNIV
jgi:methionine synthase I (cobalamin-dependent)